MVVAYLADGCNGDGSVAFSFLLPLLFWPIESKAERVRAREQQQHVPPPSPPFGLTS
jgi:hypothetical protein